MDTRLFEACHARPARMCAAVALWLLITALGLAGCNGTPAPTAAPTVPTPAPATAPGPGAIPTATSAPVATATPAAGVTPPMPQPDQMDEIRARLDEILEAPVVPPLSPLDPALPPEEVAKKVVCDRPPEELYKYEEQCQGPLFGGFATTFAAPGPGLLFQLVSLPQDRSKQLNEFAFVKEAPDKSRFYIGSLMVFQQVEFRVDQQLDGKVETSSDNPVAIERGAYFVLLRYIDKTLSFEIIDQEGKPAIENGEGQLRRFTGKLRAHQRYITDKQLCFAEGWLQTCLNMAPAVIGSNGNLAEIQKAVAKLGKVLTNPEAVRYDTALAGVVGSTAIKQCAESGAQTPEACQPSAVIAVIEPPATATGRGPGSAALITSAPPADVITDTVPEVAVVEVTQPIDDQVVDENNRRVPLPLDSYRVDVQCNPNGFCLSRYLNPNLDEFYGRAQAVEDLGELVNGEETPSGSATGVASINITLCSPGSSSSRCAKPNRAPKTFCVLGCRR